MRFRLVVDRERIGLFRHPESETIERVHIGGEAGLSDDRLDIGIDGRITQILAQRQSVVDAMFELIARPILRAAVVIEVGFADEFVDRNLAIGIGIEGAARR